MSNLPLAFAELLAGGLLLTAGIQNHTLGEALAGLTTGGVVATTAGAGGGPPPTSVKGYTNPFPGATASRVDQGVDYTTQRLLAPGRSEIVHVDAADSGWKGGGYIAGKLLDGPYAGKVWYMAEGLTPAVTQGQIVGAGQSVATPAHSPYNGILGNIEAGWADPSQPARPLAQTTGGYIEGMSTAAGAAFNRWAQALGAPLGQLSSGLRGSVAGQGL